MNDKIRVKRNYEQRQRKRKTVYIGNRVNDFNNKFIYSERKNVTLKSRPIVLKTKTKQKIKQ